MNFPFLTLGRKKSKRPAKKAAKKKSKNPFRRIAWFLLFLFLLCITLGTTGYLIFLKQPAISPREKPFSPAPIPRERHNNTKVTSLPPRTATIPREKKEHPDTRPRIALVIDDMGYHKAEGEGFLAIDLPLTYAFLPFAPFTREQNMIARQEGREILLHLPLEPHDHTWRPEPGVLYVSMTEEEAKRTLEEDLAAVSGAVGINNHMGSRYTEDEKAMTRLLTLINNNNLIFLDSLTSPKSVGYPLARSIGMMAVRRSLFLDNAREKGAIIVQLEALLAMAEKEGQALGIGHPYQETLDALKEFLPVLNRRVKMIGIREYAANKPN